MFSCVCVCVCVCVPCALIILVHLCLKPLADIPPPLPQVEEYTNWNLGTFICDFLAFWAPGVVSVFLVGDVDISCKLFFLTVLGLDIYSSNDSSMFFLTAVISCPYLSCDHTRTIAASLAGFCRVMAGRRFPCSPLQLQEHCWLHVQGRSQDIISGGASSGQSFIWGGTWLSKTTILKLTHCITQSSSFLTAHIAINNGLNLLMDTNDVLLIIPCYWNGCLDNVRVRCVMIMWGGSGP